eukprot:tig00020515_g9776.t1
MASKPAAAPSKPAAAAPAKSGAAVKHKSKYSKTDVLMLKAVFDGIDTNGSGKVSTYEFAAALKASPSSAHLAEHAADLVKHSDKDKDGKLSADETLALLYPFANERDKHIMLRWWNPPAPKVAPPPPPALSDAQKREIASIFSVYDKNKDGMLTVEELTEALQKIMSSEEVEEMFQRYDADKSKTISPKEFEEMMFESYLGAAK